VRSFNDRDLASHVGVKPAIIIHSAAGLKHNARGCRWCNHDVPSAVACRRCVRNKVGIDPFDRVADVSTDLRRHESQLFDLDLNGFGARRLCHEDKKERADCSAGDWTTHLVALLEFRRNMLGMLLMPLEDFQACGEEVLELRIARRGNERVLQRAVDRLVVGDLVVDVRLIEGRTAELGKFVALCGRLLGERLAGIVVFRGDVEFLHQCQSLVIYRLVITLHVLRKGDNIFVAALLQRLLRGLDVKLTRRVGDVGDLGIGEFGALRQDSHGCKQ